MKVKAFVFALFVAGMVASLALAKAPKPPKPGSTTTTTTTAAKPKCNQVELKGKATAGSISFTVAKASKRGTTLVGTTVTLAVPPSAKIKAKVCTTPGSSALTLRDLHAKVHSTP